MSSQTVNHVSERSRYFRHARSKFPCCFLGKLPENGLLPIKEVEDEEHRKQGTQDRKATRGACSIPAKGLPRCVLLVCRHPSDPDRADRSQTGSESEISASTCLERRFGQMQNILRLNSYKNMETK